MPIPPAPSHTEAEVGPTWIMRFLHLSSLGADPQGLFSLPREGQATAALHCRGPTVWTLPRLAAQASALCYAWLPPHY